MPQVGSLAADGLLHWYSDDGTGLYVPLSEM